MAAFLIYRAWVRDPVAYRAYMACTPELIRRHGGRFLARGGASETLEGDPETARTIIVEFPDLAAARAFYRSGDYQAAIDLRRRCADVQMVIVDGIRPGETENPPIPTPAGTL
ncbi:MAG: DUF1330 domain-containing protein [Pseudomonadota bacterium]|nr:DUF1330 domain-containing protein [Pseudomonadota bacterium]